MASFNEKSLNKLSECHGNLQMLMREVVKYHDCSIVEGRRPKEVQDRYYAEGRTKVQYPDSKHNTEAPELSRAVDVVPYIPAMGGQVWPNQKTDSPEEYLRKMGAFYVFVGYVRATADRLGIKIRCGADWDGDFDTTDQRFHDLPHFEIVG